MSTMTTTDKLTRAEQSTLDALTDAEREVLTDMRHDEITPGYGRGFIECGTDMSALYQNQVPGIKLAIEELFSTPNGDGTYSHHRGSLWVKGLIERSIYCGQARISLTRNGRRLANALRSA